MRLRNADFLVYNKCFILEIILHLSNNIVNNLVSFFLHVAFYHCPRVIMATREKGRKKTKQEAPQEASQQFKVTDPISMADLENIHTGRGKYPSRPPPFGPKTWELAQKEKEKRVFKERRERPLSTPLGTTSTDSMDTEEAQEFSKEIVEKVIERELKKT